MKRRLLCLLLAVAAAGVLRIYPGSAAVSAAPVSGGIVIDADTNRILGGFHWDARLPMASTTKVLTAITVLETLSLDRVVAVPACAAGVEGSSIYLQAGEKLTVKQLLYGLMLQSGNDCAVTLACAAGGSVEKFAELMNRKAEEIGAKNSHFVNPHGLHDDNHYTTAYDLAIITSYALKNPDFAEIVATRKVKIPYAGRDYDRVLVNKNKMLAMYPGATGVKTGFTKRAGRCLVSSASREGINLVCVVLNCGDMWERSMALMDGVFADYVSLEVLPENCVLDTFEVPNTDGKKVRAGTRDARRLTVKKGSESSVRCEKIYDAAPRAPMDAGSEIGKFEIYYENQLIFSEKIYTIDRIEDNSFLYYLQNILKGFYG